MPYDVFGAMQAKSCSPEGRKRTLPPRRTWRCLTNESMPIMTVGAYRCKYVELRDDRRAARELADQPYRPRVRRLVGLIPAVRRRPFHAAHLRQSLLHEVRAVLHASLHSCLSCLLLHSRLHARCVESHSTLH